MEVLKLAYRKMDQLENRIHKCFEVCGVVLLATAFLSIFVQVLYRFIISRFLILPLSFTEELSRFCLFWLIYLELPITVKQGLESANTFFINRCKGVPKLFLYIVVQCICLFVAVVAFRYSLVCCLYLSDMPLMFLGLSQKKRNHLKIWDREVLSNAGTDYSGGFYSCHCHWRTY